MGSVKRSWLLQNSPVCSETKSASDKVRVKGPFERLSGVGELVERSLGAATRSYATAPVVP
jgi:hypothetical protein